MKNFQTKKKITCMTVELSASEPMLYREKFSQFQEGLIWNQIHTLHRVCIILLMTSNRFLTILFHYSTNCRVKSQQIIIVYTRVFWENCFLDYNPRANAGFYMYADTIKLKHSTAREAKSITLAGLNLISILYNPCYAQTCIILKNTLLTWKTETYHNQFDELSTLPEVSSLGKPRSSWELYSETNLLDLTLYPMEEPQRLPPKRQVQAQSLAYESEIKPFKQKHLKKKLLNCRRKLTVVT